MFNEKADFYKIYCDTKLIDIKYDIQDVIISVSTLFRKKSFPLVIGHNNTLDMDFPVCFILNEKKLDEFIKNVHDEVDNNKQKVMIKK